MAINILVILFSLLLLLNGCFFLTHVHKNFMLFKPESNLALQKILLFSGIALIVIALFGILAVILNSTIMIVIVLIAGCVGCVVPELLLIQFINK